MYEDYQGGDLMLAEIVGVVGHALVNIVVIVIVNQKED